MFLNHYVETNVEGQNAEVRSSSPGTWLECRPLATLPGVHTSGTQEEKGPLQGQSRGLGLFSLLFQATWEVL